MYFLHQMSTHGVLSWYANGNPNKITFSYFDISLHHAKTRCL